MRQPPHTPWTVEELKRQRNIALGFSTDPSSRATYSSALNSYITFCDIHHFPIDPTPDTLSFYIVFMCYHISPDSVAGYLSGIIHELRAYFPEVKANRHSALVSRTLAGCKKLYGKPTKRKLPLSIDFIRSHLDSLPVQPSHDELLFGAILATGTRGLLRLGEMTTPDKLTLRNPRKYSLRSRVELLKDGFSLWLQTHKTDKAFQGAKIVVLYHRRLDAPGIFRAYLESRDTKFPLNPFLWLTSSGSVPTRSWFMTRFRKICVDRQYAGQSMRSGGATFLAEEGVSRDLIQAIGRWSSDAFNIYIRKNPVLLQSIIASKSLSTPSPPS